MKIKCLSFGSISDIVKDTEFTLKYMSDTHKLKNLLMKKYPALKNSKFIIAVNQKVVRKVTPLRNGDEVALLAPFAGG